MANEQFWTTSNCPQVARPEAAKNFLEQWDFRPAALGNQVTATVDSGEFKLYGRAPFDPYKSDKVDDLTDEPISEHIAREEFLLCLTQHLSEDLIVQTVSHTKTRYPFGMHISVADATTGDVTTLNTKDIISQLAAGVDGIFPNSKNK
jgi:hypothetical protein